MTIRELAIMVKNMRTMQKGYFKSRSTEALRSSIEHEKSVDEVVECILSQPEVTQTAGSDPDAPSGQPLDRHTAIRELKLRHERKLRAPYQLPER